MTMAPQVVAAAPCRIQGELPEGMHGSYFRIGPHPHDDSPLARWGTYPGLLHEVTIGDGRATYRSSRMGVLEGPSANVMADGDELIAVGEWGPFWSIDRPSLAAQLRPLASGSETTVAHAHADADGRLVVTVVDYDEMSASAWSWSDDDWTLRRAVSLPARAFIHDAQVIGSDLVIGLHPLMWSSSGLRWDARMNESTWLIATLDTDAEPIMAPAAPCFVWHGGWSSSDPRELVMRAPVRPTPGIFAAERVIDSSVLPGVREWVLDHRAREVRERQLTDDPCDFPVAMGEDLVVALAGTLGNSIDYTRCAGIAVVGSVGEVARRMHPTGSFGGEFRPVDTSFGTVLMGLVVDPASDSTTLEVLDARDVAGAPLASVVIPTLVPAGLHSAWLSTAHAEPQ